LVAYVDVGGGEPGMPAVDGSLLFNVGGGGTGNRTYNEVPAGLVNGINKTFSTAAKFIPGSQVVFFNGQRLQPGAGNDYQISESVLGAGYDTITLEVAPRSRPGPRVDDQVVLDYTVSA
jgi:hypothetical protein